jgi:hypothetical protein
MQSCLHRICLLQQLWQQRQVWRRQASWAGSWLATRLPRWHRCTGHLWQLLVCAATALHSYIDTGVLAACCSHVDQQPIPVAAAGHCFIGGFFYSRQSQQHHQRPSTLAHRVAADVQQPGSHPHLCYCAMQQQYSLGSQHSPCPQQVRLLLLPRHRITLCTRAAQQ